VNCKTTVCILPRCLALEKINVVTWNLGTLRTFMLGLVFQCDVFKGGVFFSLVPPLKERWSFYAKSCCGISPLAEACGALPFSPSNVESVL